MSGWEDDDDLFAADEEETDLGNENEEKIQAVQRSNEENNRIHKEIRTTKKKNRRVKVKPMPDGMRSKWPGLVSCLFTMDNGKQVLFVKGV